MAELFTEKEIVDYMRAEVKAAGGAKKWLRKHKIANLNHVLHMIEDGRAATLSECQRALGFRKVTRYEPTSA